MKEIFLSKGMVALVDDEDFDFLSKFNWYANHYGYAVRSVNGDSNKKIFMHREIMRVNIGDQTQVDHVDRNTLDNRRINLRTCTKSENQYNRSKQKNNTSGYKGVTWAKWANKWLAQIGHNGKSRKLGYFSDPELAHNAYCDAAKILHKEFARTE